jgi:hypothetical protein
MGQTAKIIIFCSICPGMEITQLKVFNRKKKSGRFGEKFGKTKLK